MNIHILHATIVNPDGCLEADIRIADGVVAAIEKRGTLPAGGEDFRTVDAANLLVIPGGVDPHVHLSLSTPAGPSSDDFITGSRAALAGGVLHLIDFVTPLRGQSLAEAYLLRKQEAAGCLTDISFHMGISGWLDDMEKQMEICVKEYGIRSFKTYLAYRNTIGIGFDELEKIMRIAARLDAVVLVHAEDDDMIDALKQHYLSQGKTTPRYHALSRPPMSESTAVVKTLDLTRRTGCKTYFVHISAAESADAIALAKKQGLPVFAETCPQYLVLDDTVYTDDFEKSAAWVFSPPARPSRHREALWHHVLENTFDTIGTDHCPFLMHQKRRGKDDFTLIPNGAGGIEFRLPLMYSEGVHKRGMSLPQWVRLTSTNAAQIFGIAGRGSIRQNEPAGLVLFDPSAETTLSAATQIQNCDSNIYEGMKVRGSRKVEGRRQKVEGRRQKVEGRR
jgi:dihydropyrimidinase